MLGILACFAWTFSLTFLLFKVLKATMGLRVSPEEEIEGLDISEHGGSAYPDFEVHSYGGTSPISGVIPSHGLAGAVKPRPVEQS